MKYYINPINAKLKTLLDVDSCERFVDDLLRNKGKSVELKTFDGYFDGYFDEDGEVLSFKLTTTKEVRWNDGGYWSVDLSKILFNMVFSERLPSLFPDELFEM